MCLHQERASQAEVHKRTHSDSAGWLFDIRLPLHQNALHFKDFGRELMDAVGRSGVLKHGKRRIVERLHVKFGLNVQHVRVIRESLFQASQRSERGREIGLAFVAFYSPNSGEANDIESAFAAVRCSMGGPRAESLRAAGERQKMRAVASEAIAALACSSSRAPPRIAPHGSRNAGVTRRRGAKDIETHPVTPEPA